jgi:TatA/E family protein of Tat protein translocase
VALLVFGASRLPEIGRGMGRAISEFRKGTKEMTENLVEEAKKSPDAAGPSPTPPASPTTKGNFCIQCGTANPPEARFCSNCGSQLPPKTA